MIKKFKNFCGKPITWGAYFKLTGISCALSIFITVAYAIYCFANMRSFDRNRKNKNDDED